MIVLRIDVVVAVVVVNEDFVDAPVANEVDKVMDFNLVVVVD
jgi:hypothetical protein